MLEVHCVKMPKKVEQMSKSIKASHILVQQEFEANDLIKKLESGEQFSTLAKDFSLCPSGKRRRRSWLFLKDKWLNLLRMPLLDLRLEECPAGQNAVWLSPNQKEA